MRLHDARAGRIYATNGRDVLVGQGECFEHVGRLPPAGTGHEAIRSTVLTSQPWRSLVGLFVGRVPSTNLWPLTDSDFLATVGRRLFTSDDGGRHWEESGQLPPSSGSMGVLPTSVAYQGGTTYLGEYPLATDVTPRILASRDHGRTWTTTAHLADVRHVHAVRHDPFGEHLWVTTGDTDAASRIGRLRDGSFVPVGGGSQRWRAVDLAFTRESILWGMDCPYAETNRIFKLPRGTFDDPDPTPVPVHDVPGSVYYSATLEVDDERWVAFATAMEVGTDRTGPDSQPPMTDRGVVVAASSASDYTSWHEVASYRRYRRANDYLPVKPLPANGYVFLAADPDLGLLVNPFNARGAHGTIDQYSPDWFRRSIPSPASA